MVIHPVDGFFLQRDRKRRQSWLDQPQKWIKHFFDFGLQRWLGKRKMASRDGVERQILGVKMPVIVYLEAETEPDARHIFGQRENDRNKIIMQAVDDGDIIFFELWRN